MRDTRFSANSSIPAIPESLALRAYADRKAAPVIFTHADGYAAQGEIRTGRNFQSAVAEGYKRNEIVFACVYHKALAVSGVKVVIEDEASEEELDNHPAKALLKRPNPYWSWEDLIASIFVIQDMGGVAYYQKVRAGSGQVVQLWPLRPDWMRPQVGPNGLTGYVYKSPGAREIPLKARDVMALNIYDPLNMYGGVAPVSVLGHSGDIDNAMSAFMRAFYLDGGMPMIALTTDQDLLEQEVTRIRAGLRERYGGWQRQLEPAVFSKGVSVTRIGMTYPEMGFSEMDGRNEARICMVLGVPPIIIGAKVGLDRSTFANYAEARTSWWEDYLHPKLRFLRGQLQRQLINEFGAGIELEWDLSEIPAFQDDQNEIWTRALSQLQGGGILVDEYRYMIGLEALPNNAGQIFLRELKVLEVPLNELGEPSKGGITDTEPPPVPTTSGAGVSEPDTSVKIALSPYDEKGRLVGSNGHTD